MATEHLEDLRTDLAALRGRLARGEIDEPTYQRYRELIFEDLTPEERRQLGTATPQGKGSGARLGPSGQAGSGVRTALPSLADLHLEPGTVLFQQWRIVRELGRGGFGVVFEAQELHLGQRQAVKVLDPAMVMREELLERFRREVALMRELIHPRIVHVYDYREDVELSQALISMELVPGGTARELSAAAREAGEPVPLALILEILSQTFEALAAAHDRSVVHRDVTPGNIFLAGGSAAEILADPKRDPEVKLGDFGIAALLERSELSEKSRVLGTAAYVAPEILDPAAGKQGPPADVYGLGAVGYELLTGEPPLGRFEEPSVLRPDLPAAVEELILAMLSRRPPLRPSAAEALAQCRKIASCAEEKGPRAATGAERGTAEQGLRQAGEEARRRAQEEERRQAKTETGWRVVAEEGSRQREAVVPTEQPATKIGCLAAALTFILVLALWWSIG